MIGFRILDRLLVGTFLRLFLLFSLGAPLLFILGDAGENLDRYLDGGLSFGTVAHSYLYQYPQFIFWAFPIAALLATVFTIHPMTMHREIMAAKAGGISFHRIALPLILMGVLLSGLGLLLAELAPQTSRIATELRSDRDRQQSWRASFVYLTDAGESLSTRRLTLEDGRMAGVALQDLPRDAGERVRHTSAEGARWEAGRGWTFEQGNTRDLHPDGREVTVRFSEAYFASLREAPEDLMESVRDEDEMTYAELARFGDRLLRSGGDVGRTFTKMEQRLAIPAATLVIILFGAPLATSSKRGGTAFGIGISLATTILYLMLFRVSGALGYAGTLTPVAAAWLPNVLFLVAGVLFMSRVRT